MVDSSSSSALCFQSQPGCFVSQLRTVVIEDVVHCNESYMLQQMKYSKALNNIYSLSYYVSLHSKVLHVQKRTLKSNKFSS